MSFCKISNDVLQRCILPMIQPKFIKSPKIDNTKILIFLLNLTSCCDKCKLISYPRDRYNCCCSFRRKEFWICNKCSIKLTKCQKCKLYIHSEVIGLCKHCMDITGPGCLCKCERCESSFCDGCTIQTIITQSYPVDVTLCEKCYDILDKDEDVEVGYHGCIDFY